jgi:hypothetical protein
MEIELPRKKDASMNTPSLPSDSVGPSSPQQISNLLEKLDTKTPVTRQCLTCYRNLKQCILYAQKASIGAKQPLETHLKDIQERLEENRLRLDIWISDCSVSQGHYLDGLSEDITEVISAAFWIILEQLSAIAVEIGQLRQTALKEEVEQGKTQYVIPSLSTTIEL